MNASLHLVPLGPPVWMRSMATSASALRDIVVPNARKVGLVTCASSKWSGQCSYHLTLYHKEVGKSRKVAIDFCCLKITVLQSSLNL